MATDISHRRAAIRASVFMSVLSALQHTGCRTCADTGAPCEKTCCAMQRMRKDIRPNRAILVSPPCALGPAQGLIYIYIYIFVGPAKGSLHGSCQGLTSLFDQMSCRAEGRRRVRKTGPLRRGSRERWALRKGPRPRSRKVSHLPDFPPTIYIYIYIYIYI
jgi:hypothetical protein